jgi:hypothetical protein
MRSDWRLQYQCHALPAVQQFSGTLSAAITTSLLCFSGRPQWTFD